MNREKILLKVYRSRKGYLFFYLIVLLLVGFIGYSYYLNISPSKGFLLFSLIVIILILKTIEIHRIGDWWAITDSSFIESRSIFNKNLREIEFKSIADISLDQPLFKRIFNFGTIEIRKFMEDTSIVVPNINKPEKFINILRDAIRREIKDEKNAF